MYTGMGSPHDWSSSYSIQPCLTCHWRHLPIPILCTLPCGDAKPKGKPKSKPAQTLQKISAHRSLYARRKTAVSWGRTRRTDFGHWPQPLTFGNFRSLAIRMFFFFEIQIAIRVFFGCSLHFYSFHDSHSLYAGYVMIFNFSLLLYDLNATLSKHGNNGQQNVRTIIDRYELGKKYR